MQKIKDAFGLIEETLSKIQSEILGEITHERDILAKQKSDVANTRRTNAKRSKILKAKEVQLEKDQAEIAQSLKKVRSDKKLTEDMAEINKDRAYVEKWRKNLTNKEVTLKVQLEELEARELRLLEKKRNYKKKLEQDFLASIIKKG